MKGTTCSICGRPLVPCKVAIDVRVETGVIYTDNLWAIDGRVAGLTKAWACRHTCFEPMPVEDTPAAEEEWASAWAESQEKLAGRPERMPDGLSAIAKARRVIWAELEADADFKLGYVANVAMIIHDELHTRGYRPKLKPEDRNEIAERLLKRVFD